MLIKVLSTRHTSIGTLRHGLVYQVDPGDPRVAAILKAHSGSEGSALVEISPEQAEAEAAEVQSLELGAETPDDPTSILEGIVAKAKDAVAAAEAERDQALELAKAAEEAKATAEAERDAAIENAKAAEEAKPATKAKA